MISREDLKELLRPAGSALIAWDVHRALYNNVFNKEEFMRGLQSSIDAARKAGVPVIFTRITPYPPGFEPPASRLIRWRGSFRPEDMELVVKPLENEIVINKNTWSLFVGTNVELMLRNANRTTLVFTGIATDVGVETSARHAYALGFIPVIVRDAVSSADREAHERSLANLSRFFPTLSSSELAEFWGV
ncbi:MAG: cysteine hydrolase family protein [Nitrososphaeria archaeon]|jgi:nicotinamidase-related amidase